MVGVMCSRNLCESGDRIACPGGKCQLKCTLGKVKLTFLTGVPISRGTPPLKLSRSKCPLESSVPMSRTGQSDGPSRWTTCVGTSARDASESGHLAHDAN